VELPDTPNSTGPLLAASAAVSLHVALLLDGPMDGPGAILLNTARAARADAAGSQKNVGPRAHPPSSNSAATVRLIWLLRMRLSPGWAKHMLSMRWRAVALALRPSRPW